MTAEAKAAILKTLRAGRRFLVILHVFPDGDSIGSSIALALGLRQLGKEAVVTGEHPIPATYDFLPGTDLFVPPGEVRGTFDAAVMIDCGDLERAGNAAALLAQAGPVINIDHHGTNTAYGAINYLDTGAAAAGEMIAGILDELSIDLDLPLATALYTTLVTDTGSFRYQSTRPQTHRLAGRFLAAGVDAAQVSQAIYEHNPLPAVRLLGAALGTLQLDVDGQLAWMKLPQETFVALGAESHHTEGIINHARAVDGVEVAILLMELALGEIKVGFRSSRWVDVGRLASAFGGGGHPRAAGCTWRGSLAEAERVIVAKAREILVASDGVAQGPEGEND